MPESSIRVVLRLLPGTSAKTANFELPVKLLKKSVLLVPVEILTPTGFNRSVLFSSTLSSPEMNTPIAELPLIVLL